MISVKTFSVGALDTNAYVITDADTQHTAVIDPGNTSKELTNALAEIGKENIKYILLTHGHFDHIGAVQDYKEMFDAKVVVSKLDEPFLTDNNLNLSAQFIRGLEPVKADIILDDEDTVSLGNTVIRFIHTPGHTCGSGCFVCEEDKMIFSGDTLFYHSVGRTDFPTGNPTTLINSLGKLNRLQGDYKVFPGHDRSTTLYDEKANNPYFIYIKDRNI